MRLPLIAARSFPGLRVVVKSRGSGCLLCAAASLAHTPSCLGASQALSILHDRLCIYMRPQRPAWMDMNTPGTACLLDISSI